MKYLPIFVSLASLLAISSIQAVTREEMNSKVKLINLTN
jgi:hypothetical protein